jgi:Tfp pilus assembly protein FimT
MRLQSASNHAPMRPHTRECGVSLLELVVAVGIIMVISSMAIPAINKAVKTYQLNAAASQVADILKFTRFEAIRKNTPIKCLNSQITANGSASLWADNNGDGAAQPTEKQVLLGPSATLVSAGVVPASGSLAASVGVPSLTMITPGSDSIKFDQRGAVVVVPSAVYVFFVGNTSDSGGYRAVIVMPSGSVQVWTYAGGPSGAWQQIR